MTTGNNEHGAFHFTQNDTVAQDYSRQSFIRRFQDNPDALVDEGIITQEEFDKLEEDGVDWYGHVDELAEDYTDTSDVYLKIENPLIIDMKGERVDVKQIEDVSRQLSEGQIPEQFFDEVLDMSRGFDPDDVANYKEEIEERAREDNALEADEEIEDYMFSDATREVLEEQGIEEEFVIPDGIIIKNMIDDIGIESNQVADQYIIFDPTSIKSIKNRGSFSAIDPNIFAQVGPSAPKTNTKTNKALADFDPAKIQHVGVKEAAESGMITDDEAAVIDGVMEIFPESWRQHFEPRFSEQQFAPSAAQLKAHGIPASMRDAKIIEGVLLSDKVGELKTDARHLAVMFTHSENVSTFLHEFGEFAHKRLLTKNDASVVKAEWKKARAMKRGGTKAERNEWFSDQFRDWWLKQLNAKDSTIVSPELHGIFRKLLSAVKEVWRRLRDMGKRSPLDALFEDIVTNGREINEKYYYSAKEAASNYVIGAEASRQLIQKQGFSGNSKTMISWDPGSICPKQRRLVDFALEKAFGKSLKEIRDEDATSDVWAILADVDFWTQTFQEAIDDGIDVPCSYCYVEQARKKALSYWQKGKPISGVNFAMAKMVYETTDYRDGILKWKQGKIDDLNDRGGLRLFSFSDYVRDFHKDQVALLLKHAKARGLSVKAITKNPDLVDDFADSGITINVSIDDELSGMDWDRAADYKKKFKNVKIRTVAKNFNHYVELTQRSHQGIFPFIDVITPYHHDDTTKPMPAGYEDMGTNTRGGNQLIAWVDANDPELKERTCCLVGGKCFLPIHQKQCGANCGALAGELSVPAQVGDLPPKTQIRQATGQALSEEQRTERDNLRTLMKRSAAAAREAFRAGDDVGVAREKARMKALVENAKVRNTTRKDAGKVRSRVVKELKKSLPKKGKDGKFKGRFGADRHELLSKLHSYTKLNQEEAQGLLVERFGEYGNRIPTETEAFENRVLNIMSTNIVQATEDDLADWKLTLEDIKAYKTEGRLETQSKAIERAERRTEIREQIIEVLGGLNEEAQRTGKRLTAKDLDIKTRVRNALFAGGFQVGAVQDWDNILDILSYGDQESAPYQGVISQAGSVFDAELAEKRGGMQFMEEIQDIVKESYGIETDTELLDMFEQDTIDHDLGVFENVDGARINLVMNRAQARKRFMEFMDESLHEGFFAGQESNGKMGWTKEMVNAINDFLTDKDKIFIERQMEFYQRYYDTINEVYREMYGVNLPKNKFYTPISRENVSKEEDATFSEFLREAPFRGSGATAGGLKVRVKNMNPITLQGDMAVITRHLMEMEHFKAWGLRIRDLNAIFGHETVRRAIRENFGSDVVKNIESHIQDFSRGRIDSSQNYDAIDKLRVNFTRSVLAVKPTLFIKQLTSVVAFADSIPVVDWTTGFAKGIAGGKKTFDELYDNSVYLQDRWKRGSYERDVKAAMETDEYKGMLAKPSFLNRLMFLIRAGDMTAIIYGGYPVYKYYRNQGMSQEEAIRTFESIAQDTQQSSDLSKLSRFQKGSSIYKLFTMFKTTPTQYLRKEISAMRNYSAGRIDTKQFAKTMIIYHFMLPMIFQWVSDLFPWGPDDEDDGLPISKTMIRAAILGNLNGIFMVGDAVTWLYNQVAGIYDDAVIDIPPVQIAKDINKAIRELQDEDEDSLLAAIRAMAGAAGGVTGLPLKQTVDMTKGVSDTLSGEYDKGLAEMMGYSPYTAEKRFGDE